MIGSVHFNKWLGVCLAAVVFGSVGVGRAVAQEPTIDPVVNGEALVRLSTGGVIADFNAAFGSTTLRSVANRNIYLVRIPDGVDPDMFKASAEAYPETVWAELNYFGQVPEARGRCFYTTDGIDAQLYLDHPAWARINLAGAQVQTTGDGTVVAIVDSGIDTAHITLSNAIAPGGWNFVEQNGNVEDIGDGEDNDNDGEIDEMTGHGTHVAGIVRMIAPDALLMPIKVLDSEGLSDNFIVAQGIFHAIDEGVDVINVSVGSTYDSNAVRDAVWEAQQSGIIVVAAGGNVDTRLPEEYPALNDGAISVASTNGTGQKAYFSNYHENFVISAPGEAIVSTFPGNAYAAWDGTSMSTPMVSGVAALLLARHPEWPLDESRTNNVRLALQQSAGTLDALEPAFMGLMGAGLLDATAALSQTDAFTPAIDYAIGGAPEALVAFDVDGDGLLDLIGGGSGGVMLLEQTAGLEFAAPVLIAGGVFALASGDIDSDGATDLVLIRNTARLEVLRNEAGVLTPVGDSLPIAGDPDSLAVGDFDADGALDLAVPLQDANEVAVYYNDGGGAFVLHGSYAVGARPEQVVAADFDGDGRADLAVANRDSNSISVLLAGGAGFAPAASYTVGAEPRALVAADFDGDGAVDVVAANHESLDMRVLWNLGAGAFLLGDTFSLPAARGPNQLAAGDANCDDVADLIVTSDAEGRNTVSVLLSRGDRTFLRGVDYAVAAGPERVVARDFDGDGDSDLAVVGSVGGVVSVLGNGADCDVLVGDLNGDCVVGGGDLSLLLAAWGMSASPADLDGDGVVGAADLNLLLAAWGAACG